MMFRILVFTAALLAMMANAAPASETLSTEAQAQMQAAFEGLVTRLELSETQTPVVIPILIEGGQERLAIWQEWREEVGVGRPKLQELSALGDDMGASRARTRAQLEGALSADQLGVWDTIQEERAAQFREQLLNDNAMWAQ